MVVDCDGDGCGAGLVVVGVGRGVADFVGVGLGEGEELGVRETEVVAKYGVGDVLWWRTCLCVGGVTGAGFFGAEAPASAVVPTTRPVRAPPTALTPATVSERPRAGPP